MANRLSRWARPNATVAADGREALQGLKTASHAIYSPLRRVAGSANARSPGPGASYWQPNQNIGQDAGEMVEAVGDLSHAIYSPTKKGADHLKPYADRFLDPVATFAAANASISLGIGAAGLAARALAPDGMTQWAVEHPVATGIAAGAAVAATYGLANWKLVWPKVKEQWQRTTTPTWKNYAKTLVAYPLLATALALGDARQSEGWGKLEDMATGDYMWDGIKETPGALGNYIADKAVFWKDGESESPEAPSRTAAAYRTPTGQPWEEIEKNLQVRHLYWQGGGSARAYQKCDPEHLANGNGGLTNRLGKTGQKRNHGGLDVPAPVGTKLNAPAPGRIVEIDSDWQRARRGTPEYNNGNHIVLDMDSGEQVWYLHMDRDGFGGGFKVGDRVDTSNVLGQVGITGNADGQNPHVHVQMRKDGRLVDPTPYFSGCR